MPVTAHGRGFRHPQGCGVRVGGLWWWVRGLVCALGGLSVVGCATTPGSSGLSASIVAVRVGIPVYEPSWSGHARALFALTGDHRIARIDLSPQWNGSLTAAHTMVSVPFADVGENLVTGVSGAGVQVALTMFAKAAHGDADFEGVFPGKASVWKPSLSISATP
jgi:hypothetical protein